jgi:glycosyltransferase involved in cell wall biosynthesis
VYLTYPFVLSWSLLEAMACGAAIVASRTAPVTEAIADNENGLLFDFFDADALVERVVEAVGNGARVRQCRANARITAVERYDFKRVCLPAQLKLLSDTVGAAL